jgi:EmrB/QacA subfamily drug resistance transporter
VNVEIESIPSGGVPSLTKREVYITLAGVMLALFTSSLNQTVVGTAMPRIITELGGFAQYTLVTTAFLITSTIVVPISGKLTDMYGRKPLFIIGIGIFALGSLLCGLSQTMNQLIIFRALQGLGGGIMMANTITVIADIFPPAERGKYVGFTSGIFGISSIIGPILGGFLTDTLSWQWVFYINVPLNIFVLAMFIRFFPNIKPSNPKGRVDYAGITTLILAVAPAMLALSWGGVEYPWFSAPIIGIFAFSFVMLALFLVIEKRSKEAVIPLSLFKNRIVAIAQIIIFINGIAMMGTIIFIPLFFQGVKGTSATVSGSFLIPMMLANVAGTIVAGQLLSRTGGHYRLQGIFAMALMAAGMFMLSTMTLDTSYTRAALYMVLMGIGLGMTMPLYTLAVQNAVPYSVLGVATSATVFFRSVGGALGLAIFGSVMNNSFFSSFFNGLSPEIKAIIPPERLTSLVENPQALVNAQAQAGLRAFLESLGPQGAAYYEQILHALRQALNSALSQVFLIGMGIVILAFICNLFIREVPLRKRHEFGGSQPSAVPGG